MSSVLVVDDTPETAEFTRLILHSARYAVAVCGGGRAALAALAGGAPDLVVLDLDMPEIDGWQVLRHIRGNPALAGTRVLIYTAAADPTASAPSDVAPDAVLAKDAGPHELLRAVGALAGA
jgi:CheY-like chemotaxis protein